MTLVTLDPARRGTLAHTTDDPADEPKIRFTIFFHAPFDRVFALTSLGAMGIVLVVYATPTPVQVAGAIIAAVTLPWAARIAHGELRTPRAERDFEITAQVVVNRPLVEINTAPSMAQARRALPPRRIPSRAAARRGKGRRAA